jgi:hypothetical protein
MPLHSGQATAECRAPISRLKGGTLAPKAHAAEELKVATRTVTRMRPETVYFGGVAYIAIGKLRQQIADGLKKRRSRR